VPTAAIFANSGYVCSISSIKRKKSGLEDEKGHVLAASWKSIFQPADQGQLILRFHTDTMLHPTPVSTGQSSPGSTERGSQGIQMNLRLVANGQR
jgi:hypothetical protein